MKTNRLWLSALLATCLSMGSFSATLALAQPKKGAKPKSEKVEKPAEKAEETPREETLANDSGDVSVPRPEGYGEGGVRPSPLTPAPREFPSRDVDGGAPPPDYDKIMSDIVLLRARVAAVSNTLFRSRMVVSMQIEGDARVGRLFVSLDDGVVFTAPSGFHPNDLAPVFEQAVAPGKHAITIDLEQLDPKDESFRHEERTRFVVDVPKDSRANVELTLTDKSTMGADFPSDKSGKYDVKWRANVVARKLPAGEPRK